MEHGDRFGIKCWGTSIFVSFVYMYIIRPRVQLICTPMITIYPTILTASSVPLTHISSNFMTSLPRTKLIKQRLAPEISTLFNIRLLSFWLINSAEFKHGTTWRDHLLCVIHSETSRLRLSAQQCYSNSTAASGSVALQDEATITSIASNSFIARSMIPWIVCE